MILRLVNDIDRLRRFAVGAGTTISNRYRQSLFENNNNNKGRKASTHSYASIFVYRSSRRCTGDVEKVELADDNEVNRVEEELN